MGKIIVYKLITIMKVEKNSIQQYLREISNKPLLDHEEMYLLGAKITAMKALGVSPSLEKPELSKFSAEEQEVIKEGMRAFERFVEGSLRLVVFIAKKYNKKSSDFLNLIQLGNLGLIRAIDKFDFSTGYKFSTYAYWWIKQSIARGLTNTGRTIRLPIHISDRLDKINRIIHKLTQETGKRPSVSQIAELAKLKPEEVQFVLDSDYKVNSLNIPLNDEEGTEIQDLIYDESANSEDDLGEILDSAMKSHLTEVQQRILRMFFGMDGRNYSLREISIGLGINRDMVEVEKEVAMGLLREHCQGLEDYF